MFLSAFLLFALQPMAGKMLLPWFGGTSHVWATSLLFFSTVLFAGYAYVVWLSGKDAPVQYRIHRILAGVSSIIVFTLLTVFGSFYAPLSWIAGLAAPAPLLVLAALFLAIGLPFFLLSTTGPLLQHWYGRASGREPYQLYVVSNAGSLIALLAYPFFIEPSLTLSYQHVVWGILFVLEAVLILIAGKRFLKGSAFMAPAASAQAAQTPQKSPSFIHTLKDIFNAQSRPWIALSLFPAYLLVATTTEITQVIAPLPLLWVVPLALYLLSFIVGFATSGGRLLSIIGAAAAIVLYMSIPQYLIFPRLISALAVLFFAAWYCHGRLYDLRPEVRALPRFYLLLSLGGMLGSFTAAILAPLILPNFWEFPLGVAVSSGFIGAYLLQRLTWPLLKETARVSMYALPIACAFYLLYGDMQNLRAYTYADRNFYGTIKIADTEEVRTLYHGSTLHGLQYKDEMLEGLPNTYYASETGVGRAIMHARSARSDHTISIGVIGLGAGSLAGYCMPGDRFVFYEIDPQIEDVAREYFTYLEECAGSEVVIGDGRIELEKALAKDGSQKFDVLVIDAFTDDTIPVHLLTREAIDIYRAHLAGPESVLAVHVSNRYLNLVPVLMAHAQDARLSLLPITTGWLPGSISAPSAWVLLSEGESTFTAGIFQNTFSVLPGKEGIRWTDDYSEILSVVMW